MKEGSYKSKIMNIFSLLKLKNRLFHLKKNKIQKKMTIKLSEAQIAIISIGLGLSAFWTLLYIVFGIIGSVFSSLFDEFSSTPLYVKILLYLFPIIIAPITLFVGFAFKQTRLFVSIATIGTVIALLSSIAMLIATTVEFSKMDYLIDEQDRPKIQQIEKEGNCCVAIDVYKERRTIQSIKILPECHLVANKTVQLYPDDCTTDFGMNACSMKFNPSEPYQYICQKDVMSDKIFAITEIVFQAIQVIYNLFVVSYLIWNSITFGKETKNSSDSIRSSQPQVNNDSDENEL